MKQESCSSHGSIFCTGAVIIHHDSVLFQEACQLALEQVIYSTSMSFALALGCLWSFLIPDYLLPQSLSLYGCHTGPSWACQVSHVVLFSPQHCQNANTAGFIESPLLVKHHYGLIMYKSQNSNIIEHLPFEKFIFFLNTKCVTWLNLGDVYISQYK